MEIDVLGKPIGRQDQYASALGGFNFIEFMPRGGGVRVRADRLPSTDAGASAPIARCSSTPDVSAPHRTCSVNSARRSSRAVPPTTLIGMRDLAHELREMLGRGDVDGVGLGAAP